MNKNYGRFVGKLLPFQAVHRSLKRVCVLGRRPLGSINQQAMLAGTAVNCDGATVYKLSLLHYIITKAATCVPRGTPALLWYAAFIRWPMTSCYCDVTMTSFVPRTIKKYNIDYMASSFILDSTFVK